MVSLERAAQCIGRPVKHLHADVSGTVSHVSKHDVYVQLEKDGEVIPCMPENLEWDQRTYEPLVHALLNKQDSNDPQAAYSHDENEEISYIFSPYTANDDDVDHLLYVVLHMMRRVHPVRPTADPWAAYLFEEVLGWAQP